MSVRDPLQQAAPPNPDGSRGRHHFLAYLVTNTVNGKRYVGITTKTIATRWASHKKGARDGIRFPLPSAIRKHGPDAFTVEPIACAQSWEDLCSVERALIAQWGTFWSDGNGYNATRGGDGSPGHLLTDTQRKRMGDMNRGRKRDPAAVARTAEANRGRKRTIETRTRMSEAARSRGPNPPPTDVARARMSAASKARWRSGGFAGRRIAHDDATRAVIGEASRAIWQDPAYREKQRTVRIGRAQPAIQKARCSATHGGGPVAVDGVVYASAREVERHLHVSWHTVQKWFASGRAVRTTTDAYLAHQQEGDD